MSRDLADRMTNIRLPRAVCAVVAEVLDGSHETREALFEEAGVPGPPPDLPHHSKWKTWLQRAGDDTSVDSLAVIGRLIEEFMDLPPLPAPPSADVFGLGIGHDPVAEYNQKRTRLNTVLEEHGFRYFRGGRVLPNDAAQSDPTPITSTPDTTASPSSIEELLQRLLRGLPRAMYPLAYRCLGAQLAISVNNCPPPRDPRSRMTSFKRTQRKYVQKAYRVRNWREYETGLRARGSLTVWLGLTDGKLANWNSPRPTRRKPGRQRKYSNHAIETTVTVGLVFGLASRQTEGFLRSLLTLLNLDNDVPDHSTISRRKARLGKVASYERRTVKPVHLRIDSSGLSVHVGQLRTPPKARDYRKLHLAVDEQTSDVVACELTSKRARDASRVASLVGQIERPIASAKADAAYDTGDVYKTLETHRAHRSPKVLIPPRKGAPLALDSAGTRQRNRHIRARSRVGKRKWYVASGYSRRSKVETTFHRYKAILGSAMRARGLASQRVEVRLGCKILNTMTALGIPDGEMIG